MFFLPESMHTLCPALALSSLSRQCKLGMVWVWPLGPWGWPGPTWLALGPEPGTLGPPGSNTQHSSHSWLLCLSDSTQSSRDAFYFVSLMTIFSKSSKLRGFRSTLCFFLQRRYGPWHGRGAEMTVCPCFSLHRIESLQKQLWASFNWYVYIHTNSHTNPIQV